MYRFIQMMSYFSRNGAAFILFVIILNSFLLFSVNTSAKVKLPAQVTLELAQPLGQNEPLKFIIAVNSLIPFENGRVYLTMPPNGSAQSSEVLVWAGNSDSPFTQTFEHSFSKPTIGKYKYKVTFELSKKGNSNKFLKVSKNLFVDIQSDKIASSNISFSHIKRVELQKELEKRGLRDLPDVQQKAVAPELIKQIDELHKLETVPQEHKPEELHEKTQSPIKKAPLKGVKSEVKIIESDHSQEKTIQNHSPIKPSEGIKNETESTEKNNSSNKVIHRPVNREAYIDEKNEVIIPEKGVSYEKIIQMPSSKKDYSTSEQALEKRSAC